MNDRSSTARPGFARYVLLTVGLASLMIAAPSPARAEAGDYWMCQGAQSALCTTLLLGCDPPNRVCVDDPNLFDQKKTCVCKQACDDSSTCAGNEACYLHHCWSNVSCNTIHDCPSDATCTDGSCRKVGACTASSDCSSGSPDCIGGTCGTLMPGQCTSDSQCGGDPCNPQHCETAANRCAQSRPHPCSEIVDARCIATSTTEFQCFVPACTSDAQCATDPCETGQRCELRTGHCIPGHAACDAGDVCIALRFGGHQCLAQIAREPTAHVDYTPVITRPHFRLIPDVGSLGPNSPGRFVLTGALPAASFAKNGPGTVHVVAARADGALLIDATVGAGGKTGAWSQDARTHGWRWKATDAKSPIESVVLQPADGKRSDLDFEVHGRTLPLPVTAGTQASSTQYGAELWFKATGSDAKAVGAAIAFGDCKGSEVEGAKATECNGDPVP